MYRKAAAVASKIASIVSEVSTPMFGEMLQILQVLLKHWSLEDVIIAKKQVTADVEADDFIYIYIIITTKTSPKLSLAF